MILFLLLIVVLLIGLTTAAVLGKIGGFMADPTSSQSFAGVPAGPLSADDFVHLRFDQALRGYRMDQVDQVIDALSERIRELEKGTESEPESEPESVNVSENENANATVPGTGAGSSAAGESRDPGSEAQER